MNEGRSFRNNYRFYSGDAGLCVYSQFNSRFRNSFRDRCRYFWMAQFNKLRYRQQYKQLKFMVEVHNEKVTMATEIIQHGHILLKGITAT